ncbi:DUF3945 domain-containing protein [Parapedobacter sp. 10938]|uniref:DUF3945 domain-containing protein n=1 Tax=Parapedobacter flavus TaxID=3110225 RepID=UPI002DBBCFC0|nr:DUF3945 domain-containing protein [Parapedobacter sp. 10938]MEC3880228.1 DUF3945 domain-containing protein [Parapedobacter sp. 10938]
MNEENLKTQEDRGQLSDILLVLDKEKKKIRAVENMDENGNMETVTPTKRNQSRFMQIDRQGDFVSNFFSNFWRQLKDPTRFSFFSVPAGKAIEKAKAFQQQVDSPTPEGEKEMKKHEVKAEPEKAQKQENQKDRTTTSTTPEAGEYRYRPEQIDWETMDNLGLSRENLEKRNLLEPLLKGYKTNELVPISLNLGGAVVRTDARLSLQSAQDGTVVAAIHGIRKEPNLNFPFFGHAFSKEDKENLRTTGNMGRVVHLKNPKTDEIIPSIISVDRLTNELVALRADYIKIPDEIKGLQLDEQQKQTLQEGQPLYLEGMISKKGTPFDATVQFNADKRYVEFLFDRSKLPSLNNRQGISQGESGEAPKTFRGKELTDEQYKDFKDGQTVYVPGLVDKKGQTYNGYITFNKETGKTGFEFPSQYKERVKPAEGHKTHTAVNTEGKTNEATKKIKEPLKPGQQEPKNGQQQEQNKPKAPAKSKGVRR